tara:strand:- start:793 stop:1542 length:750 start_codon:yes stop_codon:yes gene_type:complete
MQINLTTFILELINFIILVWLLHRFLYRPVQEIMRRRRAKIDEALQKSEDTKADAEQLRRQYEDQIRKWQETEGAARAALNKELAVAREAGLADIRTTIEKERKRLDVTETKRRVDAERLMEKRASRQGVTFAAKFLTRLAGPEQDQKLVDVFIEDLDDWPPDKIAPLAKAAQENNHQIEVASAHPLTPSMRKALTEKLSSRLAQKCTVDFTVDETLMTGLRVMVGPWVLQANAKDELAYFAGEVGHDH